MASAVIGSLRGQPRKAPAAAAACAVLPAAAIAKPAAPLADPLLQKLQRLYRAMSPANQKLFMIEARRMVAGQPNAIEGTTPNPLRQQAAA